METSCKDYQKYRQAQLQDGELFQDFVVDIAWQAGLAIAQYTSKPYQFAIGESRTGVEIKHDKARLAKKTGNICIEVAEKARPRPGPYAPSGIMRDGHWLYAIGDYDVVWFFANNLLRGLYKVIVANKPKYRRYETPTSQGFLVPTRDADRWAALILRPDAKGKVDKATAGLEALARELHQAAFDNPNQLELFTD